MSLLKYVIRRLLYLIPLFFGITLIVFAATRMAGDPVELMTALNPNIKEEAKHLLRVYFGLDKPLYMQYLLWLWRLIHFDLGNAYTRGGLPVTQLIGQWTWETMKIQLSGLLIALSISIPVGVMSARKQYSKTDVSMTTISLFGISMPIFYVGILAIILFAYYLGVFPSGLAHSLQPQRYPFGSYLADSLWHMSLPTLVYAYALLATLILLVRSSMLEVLRHDYVLAALASGLPERTVVYKHALRNALIPVVTVVGLYFGSMLAGAPITETVFNWPGVGRLFVEATSVLDFPIIQGITVVITLMTLAANLITDIVYGYIDPRIRLE